MSQPVWVNLAQWLGILWPIWWPAWGVEEPVRDVPVSGPIPISVLGPALTHPEPVSNTKHPAGSQEVQQLRQRLTALETSRFLHPTPHVVSSSGPLHLSSGVQPATSAGTEPLGYPYAVTSVGEPEPLGYPRAIPSTGSSTVRTSGAGWPTLEAGSDPWRSHRMDSGLARGNLWSSLSVGDATRGEPPMRLPEYDGRGDWKGFHMQLRLLGSQYQWAMEDQGKWLIACLRGDALQYAARLPQSVLSDVSTLLQALQQRFGDPMLPETYRASLLNLKKGPKEAVREYEARVHQLMIKAYPGLEGAECFETLAIEHLCNGLPDPNMALPFWSRNLVPSSKHWTWLSGTSAAGRLAADMALCYARSALKLQMMTWKLMEEPCDT